MELGIVPEESNEKKRSKHQRILALRKFFDNIDSIPLKLIFSATKLLDSDGDFEKVRIAINGILPSSIGDWWCITMEKKEMIKFKGHKLRPMIDNEQVVIPTFKGLSANYRVKFPKVGTQIAKVSFQTSLNE